MELRRAIHADRPGPGAGAEFDGDGNVALADPGEHIDQLLEHARVERRIADHFVVGGNVELRLLRAADKVEHAAVQGKGMAARRAFSARGAEAKSAAAAFRTEHHSHSPS